MEVPMVCLLSGLNPLADSSLSRRFRIPSCKCRHGRRAGECSAGVSNVTLWACVKLELS